jgi:hypothetical protein
MHKALQNLKPAFHKTTTIDNLFNSYYGFNAGVLLVEGTNRSSDLHLFAYLKHFNSLYIIFILNFVSNRSQESGSSRSLR